MSVAARVAGWQRFRNTPGPLMPASSPGHDFLSEQTGGAGRQLVEIAPGADLTTSDTTWNWIDITTKVRFNPGCAVTAGRGDESSRTSPTEFSVTLNDSNGDFTPFNPGSIYFPDLGIDTPIRARLGVGAGIYTRFQGYITSLTPKMSDSKDVRLTTLTAAGALQRLDAGVTPTTSDLYRTLTSSDATDIIGYWPFEDGPNAATVYEVKAGGGSNMIINGDFNFAEGDMTTMPGSRPLALPATGSDGVAHSPIFPNDWTTDDGWNMSWVAYIPGQPSIDMVLLELWAGDDDARRWQVIVDSSGLVKLLVYDQEGIELLSDTGFALDQFSDGSGYAYNRWLYWSLSWSDVGGSAHIDLTWFAYTSAGTIYSIGTTNILSAHLPVYPYEVRIYGGPTSSDEFGIGHIVLQLGFIPFVSLYIAAGHPYEPVVTRLRRLANDINLPITVIGTSTTSMGAQGVSGTLALLRECETADGGVLYDGFSSGVIYITRKAIENQLARLPLDMDSGDVLLPFLPTVDDQGGFNDVTVTRDGGTSARYQTDEVLDNPSVPQRQTSLTINVDSDQDVNLIHRAAFIARVTEVLDFRYSDLSFDLAKSWPRAQAWLETSLLNRVDVANVPSVISNFSPADVRLLLNGYTEKWNRLEWEIGAHTTPYDVWRAATIESSDDGTVWRLDAGTCTLVDAVDVGATSLSVASTDSHELWSTSASDYPRDVSVGGARVTVTAVSGAASPQTFTVTALPYRLKAGWSVKLWHPPVLDL